MSDIDLDDDELYEHAQSIEAARDLYVAGVLRAQARVSPHTTRSAGNRSRR